ncbi:hypothetical protein KKA17_02040 [bacterium]|nr:hypothetical protein [bacterium]MBU1884006.1 hypothetical protein [bacterium]
MQIKFNTYTLRLEEMPLDIGYASEKISVKDKDGNEHILGGQNGKTQLIISAPFMDDDLLKELQEIEKELPSGGDYEVSASLIFAEDLKDDLNLAKIKLYIDYKEEFGDFYGAKLTGEPYDNKLTKAIILISKDGAIFYDEFVKDLNDKFSQETLMRKIYAAQTCYTGKGCH